MSRSSTVFLLKRRLEATSIAPYSSLFNTNLRQAFRKATGIVSSSNTDQRAAESQKTKEESELEVQRPLQAQSEKPLLKQPKKSGKKNQTIAKQASFTPITHGNDHKLEQSKEIAEPKPSIIDLTKSLIELQTAYVAFKTVKLAIAEDIYKELQSLDQLKNVNMDAIGELIENLPSDELSKSASSMDMNSPLTDVNTAPSTANASPRSYLDIGTSTATDNAKSVLDKAPSTTMVSPTSDMVKESSDRLKKVSTRPRDLFIRQIVGKDTTYVLRLTHNPLEQWTILRIQKNAKSQDSKGSPIVRLSMFSTKKFLECITDISRIVANNTVSKASTSSIVHMKTFNDQHIYKKVYTIALYKGTTDDFDVKVEEKIPESLRSSIMFSSTLLPRFESNLAEAFKIYETAVSSGQVTPDRPRMLSDNQRNVPILKRAQRKSAPVTPKTKNARKANKAPILKQAPEKPDLVDQKDKPEPAEPFMTGIERIAKRKIVDNSTVYWMRINRFCDNNVEFFELEKVMPRDTLIFAWMSVPCARQFLECFEEVNRMLDKKLPSASSKSDVVYMKKFLDHNSADEEYSVKLTHSASASWVEIQGVDINKETREIRILSSLSPQFESNLAEVLQDYEKTRSLGKAAK